MPDVHPTAVLDGEVDLADDVRIGPNCVITGPVTIGAGTHLVGNVYVHGPTTIGRDNTVYPFACLGFAPQHGAHDPAEPGEGLVIGDGNTFRESFTVHRAFTDEGPTRIGNRNTFMVHSHVGHDSIVGDDVTLMNGVLVAGHVTMGDRSIVGGISGVHQFVRVGRGAMLGGLTGVTLDVPPFFMATGINVSPAPNLVGARRAGLSREEIEDIRWVYRTLFRQGLSRSSALDAMRERADRPLVAEYLDFIESSERGIISARPRPVRGHTIAPV
ncbi:MAG: acyl-ACP--UDP-N-acetylglucosamine O-acyltransferase [Planctomycetes bacterium]|nr:acyl-ACP--UDP-N-acetylglucosamine O-acyltransferase [Planctomycetota bacterium]